VQSLLDNSVQRVLENRVQRVLENRVQKVLENRVQRILENRVQRKMFGAQEELELTEMWNKCHSEEHNALFSPLNNMEAKRMRLAALVARIIKTCTNRI